MSQDINTDLIYGRSYNLLGETTMRSAGVALQGGLRRNSLCFQYPFLFRPGLNRWLDFGTWFIPSVMDKVMGFMGVGAASAMQRIEAEKKQPGRQDILSRLINGKDPETGTNFSTEDIVMEASILTLAGGDTLGTGLQIAFYYLSRNPAVYDKLTAEIRTTFSSMDDIAFSELSGCVYLHAFLEEALRFFAGTAFWRDADKGGANVCGIYIPEGLTVGTSQWAILHHEAYFRDSWKFDPERWIPGGKYSDQEIATMRNACRVFGLGPRSCIAMNMAKSVMLLTIASVIWAMDLRRAEDGEVKDWKRKMGYGREMKEVFQVYGSFTLEGKGPVLEFKKRT